MTRWIGTSLLAFALSGCVLTASGGEGASGANEITGFPDTPRIPLRNAGYQRGEMYSYEPQLFANISINYYREYGGKEHKVTVYYYPKRSSLEDSFEGARNAIEGTVPGAVLRNQEPLSLEKNGVRYRAFRAKYSLPMHGEQSYSELLLVELPTQFFKVRSTAPEEIAQEAEAGTEAFVGALAWDPPKK